MLFRTRSAFSKALFSSSSSSSSFGEGLLSVRGEDVSEDPNPTHPRFSLHYLTLPAVVGRSGAHWTARQALWPHTH